MSRLNHHILCKAVIPLILLAFSLNAELVITKEDRSYWAYKPIKKIVVPKINNNWSNQAIDQFILRELKKNKLTPAKRANKVDLIRRAYFDLIGLPPKPQEIDEFVHSKDPHAYEKLLDKLLASPRYGERWGRHWLDLVRYAESDGYRGDFFRPEAYKYRDYVISSFNQDKSYQRFVLEQLAGDEIAPHDPQALIATGYMRLPIYEWNQRDTETHWETILQDITDVTADVFLGSGLQCAKCHDHKFDPILQKDYYALKAFFAPLMWRNDVAASTPEEKQKQQASRKKNKELIKKIEALEAKERKKIYSKAIERFPPNIQEIMAKDEKDRTAYEKQMAYLVMEQAYHDWNKHSGKKNLYKKHKALYDSLKKTEVKLPQAMTVTDVSNKAPVTTIPGKKQDIKPGFMTVLYPAGANVNARITRPAKSPESTGRRTALAKWIVNKRNPLTTRVIVNRIWQYHFGRGLSNVPNDFGRLGERPTHPELLDWLTIRFIKGGWRFKPLHKLIMMSETYKQASINTAGDTHMTIDPTNKYLWKMSSRRLEAEVIRDSMLAVTDELKFRNSSKPSVDGKVPERSIYIKVIRNEKDEFLKAFDCADGFASNAVRNVTTTPIQSLLMINGSWIQTRVNNLSAKLIAQYKQDSKNMISHLYKKAYGRIPETRETAMAELFLKEQEDAYKGNKKTQKDAYSKAVADLCQVIFNSSEFLYVR